MNNEIRGLEPSALWNYFADLNAVPRPSKKEERVIQFMVDFGKSLNLETKVDAVGNVLIVKPATPGMENRKTVVMQSHLDMVHQKNNDTEFDFDEQGIEMFVDGDWVRARGTTLGADNGLGVATIMAILASDDIEHPEIEALFTIDEETGMTGAKNLEPGWVKGDILLNLDTEEDDEIDIGCAGGVDTSANYDYTEEPASESGTAFILRIKGLQGGHSGMEIHLGLANANILLNRILFETGKAYGLRIASIDGGGLRNAIPREAEALVVIDDLEGFRAHLEELTTDIMDEYKNVEENLLIEFFETEKPNHVMALSDQEKITSALYAMPNGVYRMSPDMEDLVETSSNMARIEAKNGRFQMHSLQRSSVESTKRDIASKVRSVFTLIGAEVEHSGDYPGWAPNPNSDILTVLDDLYEKNFGKKANVVACHAGLECGIIGEAYPQLDMISYGPTIRGAHSPDERASISSVNKFWNFTREILKNISHK
jgi:dipeptidase D